jgi:hypothetical protein
LIASHHPPPPAGEKLRSELSSTKSELQHKALVVHELQQTSESLRLNQVSSRVNPALVAA